MENKKRNSLVSLRGSALGGRVNGRVRVYTLGEGPDAHLFFSMRLWQAAAYRQERLSAFAGGALKQAA